LQIDEENEVTVNLLFSADLIWPLTKFFQTKVAPFCSWEGGDKLSDIEFPDSVPNEALFHIPRRNIRFCSLHCAKRIIEKLTNLMLNEFE
jgi:hypothetical protein